MKRIATLFHHPGAAALSARPIPAWRPAAGSSWPMENARAAAPLEGETMEWAVLAATAGA